jgi:hypothetical protein
MGCPTDVIKHHYSMIKGVFTKTCPCKRVTCSVAKTGVKPYSYCFSLMYFPYIICDLQFSTYNFYYIHTFLVSQPSIFAIQVGPLGHVGREMIFLFKSVSICDFKKIQFLKIIFKMRVSIMLRAI